MSYKISIVGSGNMANQLIHSFSFTDNAVEAVECRSPQTLVNYKDGYIGSPGTFKGELDLRILAVNDNAISEVAAHYEDDILTVHCSGSADISELGDVKNSGVFYPLQTVKASQPVSLSEVPFLLEASNPSDLGVLQEIAKSISNKTQECDSAKRRQVHLSAVFVSNFVNLLHQMAFELLDQNDLDSGLLHVLSMRNIDNIFSMGAQESLTGPAKRMDFITIQKHLEMLKDNLSSQDVYTLLSNEIIRRNKK